MLPGGNAIDQDRLPPRRPPSTPRSSLRFRRPSSRTALVVLLALPGVLTAQEQTPWYERVRFSGDFRLRSESFFREGTPDRSRLRLRLRAGLSFPIGDHLTVVARLATGQPGSVTTANVNLGSVLTRKAFGLDRAYLSWEPSDRLQIWGGKFGLSLWRPEGQIRSEALFDEEVAPEGFHELVVLASSRDGLVRRVAVHGEQWVPRESSGGSDSWMVGGQAVVELGPAAGTTLGLAAGYYGFLNGRELARARNDNDELVVSNSVVTESGELLTGGFPLTPPPGDPFDRFVSDFRLISVSGGGRISGVLGRELRAAAEWIHNTGASRANDAVWVGAGLGALRRPGDWALGVAWSRVEQEAVLSFFTYSDLGVGGTNVEGPILQAAWRPASAIVFQARHHIVSPAELAPGVNPNALHRLLVDARVSF